METFLQSIDWKKVTMNGVISYGLAWTFFFILLPFNIKFFGKITGGIVTYICSWIFMIILFYIIHTYYPSYDKTV
jgi:hypothetical protein